MVEQKIILQVIVNALIYTVWCLGFNLSLERKYSLWRTVLLQAVSFIFYTLLPQLFPYLSPLRLLVCILVPLLMLLLLFRNRYRVLVLLLVAVHVAGLLSEVLTVLVFPYMTEPDAQPFPLVEFGFNLLSNVVLLSPMLIYGAHKRMNGGIHIHPTTLLALSTFLFAQFFALSVIGGSVLQEYTASYALRLLILFLLMILMDVILFLTWRIAIQRSRIAARSELLERQLELQLSHYAALNEQFENIRKMRHDIANHIYAVRLLLEQKDLHSARDYIDSLETFAQSTPQHYCQHPMIDAYLCHRCPELEANGITVDAQLRLPAEVGIPNPDLICGIANLLDNAAEAVAAATDKCIRLRAFMRKEYLVIETENAVPPQPRPHPRRIRSLERGQGLHILQDLASVHQGEFLTQSDAQRFHATLTLYTQVEGGKAAC